MTLFKANFYIWKHVTKHVIYDWQLHKDSHMFTKTKLLSIVTPKRTSVYLDFMVKFSMFIALSVNGLKIRLIFLH